LRDKQQNANLHYLFFSSLQEKATKWQDHVEIDGLTTNGVLIMHPKGVFCGGSGKCGLWRETSVGGDVFGLRESRSAQQKGQPVSLKL
jgi:pellino